MNSVCRFEAKIRRKCERGGAFLDAAKVLKNIKLPAIYYREGKSCYYDTYRKKLSNGSAK